VDRKGELGRDEEVEREGNGMELSRWSVIREGRMRRGKRKARAAHMAVEDPEAASAGGCRCGRTNIGLTRACW